MYKKEVACTPVVWCKNGQMYTNSTVKNVFEYYSWHSENELIP